MKRSLLFLLLTAVPAFGQASLVAHTVAQSTVLNTAFTTTAIDISSCTHCMLSVCYAASTAGLPATPISDSGSNNWLLARKQSEDGDDSTELWISFPTALPSNETITAQNGFAAAVAVAAFSGVASGPD